MKTLLAIVAIFLVAVLGLSAYLGPDDLRTCTQGVQPGGVCAKADAVVAVSGGDTSARAAEAIDLYKRGWANTIIFSGAAFDKTGPSNASVMRKQALDAGVPERVILIEEQGATTKQNAEKTNDLLEENNVHSVILVTSAYHQRRASLEFNKLVGPDVSVRSHPVMADNQWSSLWWLTPTGWWLAIGEFIKIIAFYLGGSQ